MKKLGIISLVLLASLGVTGVAYGAWTDTLNITATAVTGTFDVRFDQAVSNDFGVAADPTGAGTWSDLTWTGPTAAHNKAATEVSLSTLNLTISVADAYVGYVSSVGCTIVNNGSIPVKIDNVSYVLSLPPGRTSSDLDISFSGALTAGGLIDVGSWAAGAVTIKWNGVPAAASTYSLVVNITASQWNAVS
jgi:hypothetical protein